MIRSQACSWRECFHKANLSASTITATAWCFKDQAIASIQVLGAYGRQPFPPTARLHQVLFSRLARCPTGQTVGSLGAMLGDEGNAHRFQEFEFATNTRAPDMLANTARLSADGKFV